MSKFIESVARTGKLYCSDCRADIRKGAVVVFEIDYSDPKPMQNVYCTECSGEYMDEVVDDGAHPLSGEAHGQW